MSITAGIMLSKQYIMLFFRILPTRNPREEVLIIINSDITHRLYRSKRPSLGNSDITHPDSKLVYHPPPSKFGYYPPQASEQRNSDITHHTRNSDINHAFPLFHKAVIAYSYIKHLKPVDELGYYPPVNSSITHQNTLQDHDCRGFAKP